ncbi:MAG: hypothetical protein GXP54_08005 [Deltaproteobacteria bacterium]|nr:hypothetical protein [Deltaproteobacteria bacterium]
MSRQKMTPSEAFVETLLAEGVREVFGIVGSAYMDALDLFPAAGIRFVMVAHEQAAAHAADGMARVTGRPQVCIGQNGPGAANFVSAITAAYWAHSPVVAVTPETGSMGIGTGGFQELDQMDWFRRQTVYQTRVNRPERMAELTRRAFYMAKLENGPTQLNIPRDYFYGVCEDEIYPTMEISRGMGSREALREAATLLAGATYPVILAGGGVSQGDALEETKALADYLTAPVVNSYLHNDSFPQQHPLAVGPIGYCGSKAAMRTIAKADVVLALGCRLGPFGTLPQYDIDYWPKGARIIQVDVDAKVLGLSRRVDVASCADVKEYAVGLLDEIRALKPDLKPVQARLAEVKRENDTDQRTGWMVQQGYRTDAPEAALARVDQSHARGVDRGHGYRQQLVHGEQLSEVHRCQAAHQRAQLGQLWIRVRRGPGRESGASGQACVRVPGGRGLRNQRACRGDDRGSRGYPCHRHRGRQPGVGRGKEEPD